MKFFRQNTHLVMRLFVNQIGITFFALVLTMAVSRMENSSFKLWVSIFSILFYLFLIYSVMWEAGAKNIIPIEAGRMERDPLFSLKAALCASVPNLILALLMTLFFVLGFVASLSWAGGVYGVLHIIIALFEAMYVGLFSTILASFSGTQQYLVACILYLLTWIPLTVVSVGAYALGLRNVRLFGKAPAKNDKK